MKDNSKIAIVFVYAFVIIMAGAIYVMIDEYKNLTYCKSLCDFKDKTYLKIENKECYCVDSENEIHTYGIIRNEGLSKV